MEHQYGASCGAGFSKSNARTFLCADKCVEAMYNRSLHGLPCQAHTTFRKPWQATQDMSRCRCCQHSSTATSATFNRSSANEFNEATIPPGSWQVQNENLQRCVTIPVESSTSCSGLKRVKLRSAVSWAIPKVTLCVNITWELAEKQSLSRACDWLHHFAVAFLIASARILTSDGRLTNHSRKGKGLKLSCTQLQGSGHIHNCWWVEPYYSYYCIRMKSIKPCELSWSCHITASSELSLPIELESCFPNQFLCPEGTSLYFPLPSWNRPIQTCRFEIFRFWVGRTVGEWPPRTWTFRGTMFGSLLLCCTGILNFFKTLQDTWPQLIEFRHSDWGRYQCVSVEEWAEATCI